MVDEVVTMPIWGEGDKKFLFKGDDKYQIPLYQREYAWEEKQIRQLIEDVYDVADDAQYHIGSLIVAKKEKKGQVFFEVIDGQQRLTSLFLLLKILESMKLGIKVERNLSFACREKSNYSLENIISLIEKKDYDEKKVDGGIFGGIEIFKSELRNVKQKLFEEGKISDEYNFEKSLIEKLKRVIIYRIEVPENTDLNRYFEIMNTRGEQLEHTDILKARLMGFLTDSVDRFVFATIWDACSDMSGYVQMHFKEVEKARDRIFGEKWISFPSDEWENYKKINEPVESKSSPTDGEGKNEKTNNDPVLMSDILRPDFKIQTEDGTIQKKEVINGEEKKVEKTVRFEGLIDFSYFLLHVLKVYQKEEYGSVANERLLDDKKLLDRFKDAYSQEGGDKPSFSKKFVLCLLRCRFLMDKYIVRREFIEGDNDGEWSLKELQVSGEKGKRKPYYIKTTLEVNKEDAKYNDNLKMMQSALRVSYTSPKVMHWITDELIWLMKREGKERFTLKEFAEKTESIAINAVKTSFFEKCIAKNQTDEIIEKYEMGVDTPHIVFNYLDYLLWKEKNTGYDSFAFEFRNTVEHWYPQNPSEIMFERWKKEEGLDRFGNLCLIQREINSKFSNDAPSAKKSSFKNMIAKGSLKLRRMSELTVGENEVSADFRWKKFVCEKHEKEMIGKLKKACGVL